MDRTTLTTAVVFTGLLIATTACGDDDGSAIGSSPTTEPSTTEPSAGHDDGLDDMAVMIDGVDYHFEHVPESVDAGTRLGFRNTSASELHELVAFRVGSDLPLAELLTLPPDELEATLGAPITVLLQPPGAPEPIMAVGDGTLTDPGRYVLMCFIPIGADPDEYMAAVAAAGGGKPEGVAGGPPHFTGGMFAELVVE